MFSNNKRIFLFLGIYLSVILAFSNTAIAQSVSLNYQYKLDATTATEPPEFIGAPDINYPDDARKNGIEGTLKAFFTISEDGTTKNIVIEKSLPFGVDEAVKVGLEKLRFKPAKRDGEPIETKMFFDYVVSAVYAERDKNVSKPKITSQPDAVYPSELLAEKRKGTVEVGVMFSADGSLKVLGVSSTMPKEFDQAAAKAAEQIKFEPAVHKKSKKRVSQQMVVKYKFKP